MRHTDPTGGADQDLTQRQRQVLQAIEDSVKLNGYPPSMREIGAAAGLASTSAVSYQLSVLEKKGRLSRTARRPRTAVTREPEEITRVPLVGRIHAGRPISAHEQLEDTIPMPRQLVGDGNLIMLKVVGDSMIGAAIADGDLVVVRRESDIENGDIVAAMIESDTEDETQATIKTFKKRDGHVWLLPHNPAYPPIPGDNAKIIGKVVTVLRRM
jgi:repressor LexA